EAFYEIQKIAADYHILTEPRTYGPISIIPLFAWYDYSFGQPSKALFNAWVDFKACNWPTNFDLKAVTDFFISKNKKYLNLTNEKVITFSHFLPRIDLLPIYVPQKVKALFPVLGTSALEAQIRSLMPNIHIYGHSHLNRDIKLKNIRYINNAFGYPYETRICCKELCFIMDFD
ncbi:MAG: hypothetical protein PVI90_12020, partial [Desulfobacteraceae bacterium]